MNRLTNWHLTGFQKLQQWLLIHVYMDLVGGLEHFLSFHSVGNVVTPTDELIFFRGVGQPPTSGCVGFPVCSTLWSFAKAKEWQMLLSRLRWLVRQCSLKGSAVDHTGC